MRLAPLALVAACSSSSDLTPDASACGPAPAANVSTCSSPGPGNTIPVCLTDKTCGPPCGPPTDPDCIMQCQRCDYCARCDETTHQWHTNVLDYCVLYPHCPDAGS